MKILILEICRILEKGDQYKLKQEHQGHRLEQVFYQEEKRGKVRLYIYIQYLIEIVRLSFVTSSDQARFEDIFRSAVGENIVISGEIAKSIMSKSCLTPSVLAKIW